MLANCLIMGLCIFSLEMKSYMMLLCGPSTALLFKLLVYLFLDNFLLWVVFNEFPCDLFLSPNYVYIFFWSYYTYSSKGRRA